MITIQFSVVLERADLMRRTWTLGEGNSSGEKSIRRHTTHYERVAQPLT